MFARLPRPDEILENDRSFLNGSQIPEDKNERNVGCESFVTCLERLFKQIRAIEYDIAYII